MKHFAIAGIVMVGLCSATAPARADSIDGNWCNAAGTRQMRSRSLWSSPKIAVEPSSKVAILATVAIMLLAGSRAALIYAASEVGERHRHRYEFNQAYLETIERHGLVVSGLTPDGKFVEIAELPEHPWFVAVQYHPEFKSPPRTGHPLFTSFIKAALAHQAANSQAANTGAPALQGDAA